MGRDGVPRLETLSAEIAFQQALTRTFPAGTQFRDDSRSRPGEVLGERLDDGAPHRRGQVVAHSVDDDEPRTGDGPCEAAAIARPDHRIVGAVDDDGRGADACV